MPDHRDGQQEIEEFVHNAVEFGTSIGSGVLNGLSDALSGVNIGSAAKDPLVQTKRALDRKLGDHYGGMAAMGAIGWVFAGMFGIAALVMGILALVMPYMPVFPILFVCFLPVTAGFAIMGWKGCQKAGFYKRLRRYLRSMRGWNAPVAELARACAVDRRQAGNELEQAIVDGVLPGTCLDSMRENFYLDETRCRTADQQVQQTSQPQAAQQTPADAFQAEGVAFLRYLRDCRGTLGETADTELEEMLKTCGAILGFVHNHPEQINRVQRFRDYYLPTTRKLLDTARGLGAADTQNANEIRRDITGILHTLNIAYTKLYDGLLQDVSMDVSAEIDTLEAMLNQDGLTHDFASDFGTERPKL
jgi:hypothetical protein